MWIGMRLLTCALLTLGVPSAAQAITLPVKLTHTAHLVEVGETVAVTVSIGAPNVLGNLANPSLSGFSLTLGFSESIADVVDPLGDAVFTDALGPHCRVDDGGTDWPGFPAKAQVQQPVTGGVRLVNTNLSTTFLATQAGGASSVDLVTVTFTALTIGTTTVFLDLTDPFTGLEVWDGTSRSAATIGPNNSFGITVTPEPTPALLAAAGLALLGLLRRRGRR